jgi:hypothetical protein
VALPARGEYEYDAGPLAQALARLWIELDAKRAHAVVGVVDGEGQSDVELLAHACRDAAVVWTLTIPLALSWIV